MNTSEVRSIIKAAAASESRVLPEDISKQIFSTYGIPVVQEITATDPDSAGQAATSLGFPVVLKGVAPISRTKPRWGL